MVGKRLRDERGVEATLQNRLTPHCSTPWLTGQQNVIRRSLNQIGPVRNDPFSQPRPNTANDAVGADVSSGRSSRNAVTLMIGSPSTVCRSVLRWRIWVMVLGWAMTATTVCGQLRDPLDTYPSRFRIEGDDCDAAIVQSDVRMRGGHDDGPYESITVRTGDGTTSPIIYPIDPVRPIDDLVARIWVRSATPGARIGLRIRFPYLIDPATSRSVTSIAWGASYRDAGRWSRLGIGAITGPLASAVRAARGRLGARADVRDPMIDAVCIETYGGDGTRKIELDQLSIDSMVSVGAMTSMGAMVSADADGRDASSRSRPAIDAATTDAAMMGSATTNAATTNAAPTDGSPNDFVRADLDAAAAGRVRASINRHAFPPGRLTCVVQHRGEPLRWLRTLGVDAVWCTRPPTVDLLAEAMAADVRVYAPFPAVPRQNLAAMLEPVDGWILSNRPTDGGGSVQIDARDIDAVARLAERLEQLPSRWRRPIVISPAESHADYAELADAVVIDAPVRTRRLGGDEEVRFVEYARRRCRSDVPIVMAVSLDPPENILRQNAGIASTIGSSAGGGASGRSDATFSGANSGLFVGSAGFSGATVGSRGNPWHEAWTQTMRQLVHRPAAVLIRTSAPLSADSLRVPGPSAGDTIGSLVGDASRSMSLSYINRTLHALQPVWAKTLVAAAPSDSAIGHAAASSASIGVDSDGRLRYHAGWIHGNDVDVLIATSTLRIGGQLVAGDGGQLTIALPPQRRRTIYRIGGLTTERLTPTPPQSRVGAANLTGERSRLVSSSTSTATQDETVSIISPDFVEVIVMADDPSIARQLMRAAASVRSRAMSDRWNLATADLSQTQNAWTLASALGLTSPDRPSATASRIALVAAAADTLRRGEPSYRSSDFGPAHRAARRADNWLARSRGNLAALLYRNADHQIEPTGIEHISSPPIVAGDLETAIAWFPNDAVPRSPNLIRSGDLDDPRVLDQGRWRVGRRGGDLRCRVDHVSGLGIRGSGAIRATVDHPAARRVPVPMAWTAVGGGYEGTGVQIRSPSVRMADAGTIEIHARIKTVGLTGPHQGVLVYETLGGPAAGVLMRDCDRWTQIELHRRAGRGDAVEVVFEVIGAGEAMIDDVALHVRG